MPRRVSNRIGFALLLSLLAGCPAADPSVHVQGTSCLGFGLDFAGGRYADSAYFGNSDRWHGEGTSDLAPIALGGTERVRVSGLPAYDSGVAYTADVSGPALGLAEEGLTYDTVQVTGLVDGVADLCIYDEADRLRDGTAIAVRPVDAMVVVPTPFDALTYEPVHDPYPLDGWAMFAGMRRQIGVGLIGGDDWRLVDDGLTISVSVDGEARATSPLAWDSIAVDLPYPTTAAIRATMSSGEIWDGSLDVVDEVDSIAQMSTSPASGFTNFHVGQWMAVWFTAALDGRRVLGAPWTFEVTAQAELGAFNLSHDPNCALITAVAPGAAALTASIGGRSLTVPFTVLP